MFTCQRISDVEYYLDEAEKAAEEGRASERDRAAYYLDNGAGEDKGTWWRPADEQAGALAERGAEVSPKAFRAMARGCDPRTGEPLIQQTRAERTAGYDCQFAAPKSVSVLWATAAPEVRARIEQMHRAAVHRALDFAQAEGLIITRRGKGGETKEAVTDCAVAEFMHTTSRAGDPQLHSHAVLLNVCARKDGSTGSLDNHRLLQYQGAMGAMYRAELAAGLERELGLATSKDERNFKVNGVPEEIAQRFSKRREAIENAAEEAGYTTASDRERARLAAVATRDRKSDVPERAELERRWTREMQSEGWNAAAVWASARAAREKRDRLDAAQGVNPNAWRASEKQRAGMGAVEALEATNAVLERRHMLREITERMQGVGTADDAVAEMARLEETGALVRVGTLEVEDEPVYATPAMIETERRLLRGVLDRRGERDFVPPAQVEAAIARRPTMSAEQAAAVRHALNRDGVAVVEGSAGTGKSYSLGGVADAARDAGLHVFVVAPSHKAKDVIRHDTTTDEDSAKAVQGFNNRLANPDHKEHIALTPRDCIIVDEAGMVGTREMEVLLRHAQEAGAKVILAGDTRQLQPVSAGGPMAAVAKVCGTQRIEEIRRQRIDWQRAASTDFATGRADRALEAYDRAGRLHLEADGKAALAALARDWRADVERNPEADMERPWEARLVVAGRNKDVRALNETLRAAYREAGRIRGEDVEVQAFSRGQNGKLEPLKLAAGDRLIFGESAKPGGVAVNNSDMGTVERVEPGADPMVRVRLDKGEVIEARWSDFVGFRDQDAPDSTRHPKVQHAYAVTVHASQGTTVNRCFAFNGHGMGMESAYVAMTRHREDAAMYVDASRIRDRLEARKTGSTFTMSQSGRADGRDADEQAATAGGADLAREEIAQVVLREVMRSETKANVSDFVQDKRAWARGEPQPKPSLPISPEPVPAMPLTPDGEDAIRASLATLDAMIAEGAAAPRARPVINGTGAQPPREATMQGESRGESRDRGMPLTRLRPFPGLGMAVRPTARTDEGKVLAHRMAERQQGPAYEVPRARPPITQGMRGLSPEQELEAFAKEIDLVRFLESRGYVVNTKERWANGWKMQNGSDTLHVKHGGTGHAAGMWVWTRPDGSESGTIIAYMQKVERAGNLGQVRQQLRAYMGESMEGRRPGTMAPAPVQPSATAPAPSYDFARVRYYWNAMREGANEWLVKARGLKREVLERFRGDIRTEGPGSKQNPGGACFAHRNEAGEVVGYQRKGPKHAPTDARGFSQWSSGGQKLITRMGERDRPAVIYVGETAIDLLSAYQHDGQPEGALLCALDGSTSREALEEVAKLAERHPEARILLAFDRDLPKERVNPHTGEVRIVPPAGERMAGDAEAVIRARAPQARIERHFPPAGFKDWNDAIRGVTREQAELAHAEAEQAAQAATRAAHATEDRHAQALRDRAAGQEVNRLRRELEEEMRAGALTPAQAAERRQQIERTEEELRSRQRDEERRRIREAMEAMEAAEQARTSGHGLRR